MGLLDQVLGQVLGQLGGAGAGPGAGGPVGQPANPLAPNRPGGLPPGGFGAPAPQGQGGAGGGLGGLLGGNLPPIALAILALLASKNMKTGAGGYGSVLHDMLAGTRGGASSVGPGGDVLDGQPTGQGGGFLDQIGGMLGGAASGHAASRPSANPAGRVGDPGSGGYGGDALGGGGGALGGGLGGLLGGLVGGGLLNGGLGNLVDQLSRGGLGDKAQSWVGHGSNEPVDPGELHQALGDDTVDDLSQATGLDRGDLLSQLSKALPGVVDRLTPHGRLPSEHEESTWV